MRLEYTLTPADVHEATAQLKANGKPMRLLVVLFGLVYLLLFPWIFLPLSRTRSDPARAVNLWAIVAPGTITATVVAMLILLNRRDRRRAVGAAPASGASMSRGAARLLGLILLAPFGLIGVVLLPGTALVGHPSDLLVMLVALAPVQLLGLAFVPSWWVGQRRRGQRMWDASPWLRRATVVDVSDHGITAADDQVQTRYQWSFLHRFLERPNVFLIYTEAGHALIIPRRAFPSGMAEQAFRGLLQTHVGHGRFQPRGVGFPVLPLDDAPLVAEPGQPVNSQAP